MTEEKDNKKEEKKEDCPLCNVSEETIKRLKEEANKQSQKKDD